MVPNSFCRTLVTPNIQPELKKKPKTKLSPEARRTRSPATGGLDPQVNWDEVNGKIKTIHSIIFKAPSVSFKWLKLLHSAVY